MELNPYEFEKAKDGDIFVKSGNRIVAVSFSDLAKDIIKETEKISNMNFEIKTANKRLDKLTKFSKRNFITVFTIFELKALQGEIEVEEELLNLDEKVLSGELGVEEAINQHEYLLKVFNALFDETEE